MLFPTSFQQRHLADRRRRLIVAAVLTMEAA